MKEFWLNIILPFLENEIVVNWIAPIVTSLIVLAIPVIISKMLRSYNNVKKINETNKKIINTIRPFIIQQIDINLQSIVNIRDAIIKESQLKDKEVYSIEDIQNKLLLDIAETRYLKEQEKQNLMNFTYKVFSSNVKLKKSIAENVKIKNRMKKKKIFIIELVTVLIASITGILIESNDINYQENPLFIICIAIIIGIFAIEYLQLLIGNSEYTLFAYDMVNTVNRILNRKKGDKNI